MIINKLSILGIWSISSFLVAAERPTLPPSAEDTGLVTEDPAAFFQKRKENTACQESLNKHRELYLKDRKILADLVEKKAPKAEIDKREVEFKQNRDKFLGFLESCGECVTHPMEGREVIEAGRREYWYIADGSCYVPGAKFKETIDFLRSVGGYAGKHGGFPAVMEFIGETDAQGEPLYRADYSPFHSFIMVRGPEVLGVVSGFFYSFASEFFESAADFAIRFNSEDPHPKVPVPNRFVDKSASGKIKMVAPMGLRSAMGLWYVTSKGYLRYYTAGDFRVESDGAKKLGRKTLLDTLSTLAEVASGTERP